MSFQSHGNGRLVLAYESIGEGDHLLVCLHGFGKDRTDFKFLAEFLSKSHTSLLIDLPFHGDSKMDIMVGEEPISEVEWIDWLSSLIVAKAKREHSILGFSMGGRLALTYAQSPLKGFKGLILLATDGILMNPWNRVFTHTQLGRKIFSYYMRPKSKPESIAHQFERLNLISAKRKKLIVNNVSGPEAKNRLLSTWLVLRKLWPDLNRVDTSLKDGAYVRVFLGRFDYVIRPHTIRKRLEDNELSWPLIELNCGHDMMNQAVLMIIGEELSKKAGIE